MKHKFYECNCGDESRCHTCQGLLHCKVCNGAEGSLTKDCCGRPLTEDEESRIGPLDYVNGMWVDDKRDCKIEYYRSSSQRANESPIGASITHIASGLNARSHICNTKIHNLFVVKKRLLELLTQLPRTVITELNEEAMKLI